EIAVAEHRDRVAAEILQCQRRAYRKARSGAEPAAAVLAEIGKPVLERPDVDRPAAAERAEAHVLRIVEFRAQRGRDLLHGDALPVRGLGLGRRTRLPRILAAGRT